MPDEVAITARFEQIFYDSFHADIRPTLAVVCFALGTWVGGMYTTSCCRLLAAKGYPITVISPGNNKQEILRVVRELAPAFAQVVLLGYQPFLKDVIDSGRTPKLTRRPRVSGSPTIALISLLSLSMIAVGVAAGAQMPNQPLAS